MSSSTTAPVAVPEKTAGRRAFGRRKDSNGPSVTRKPGPFVWTVITILCFLWVVPTLGLFVTSFRTGESALDSGWWTVLKSPFDLTQWTVANYSDVWTEGGLARSFLNSFVVSVPATVIPIMIAAFAAYAFTFMSFRGR